MPRSRRKHFWTTEQDQLLLKMYDGHREHPKRLYALLPYPRWAVRHRARDLGLTRIKEPRWSVADEQFLRMHIGTMSWRKLARKVHRTIVAVKLHGKRMGLRKTKVGLTANSAAKLLGCDIHKVRSWIHRGWLPAERRGTDRFPKQGGDIYFITPDALRRLIIEHPEEIDLRRVDKLAFIDLLIGRYIFAGRIVKAKNLSRIAGSAARLDLAMRAAAMGS